MNNRRSNPFADFKKLDYGKCMTSYKPTPNMCTNTCPRNLSSPTTQFSFTTPKGTTLTRSSDDTGSVSAKLGVPGLNVGYTISVNKATNTSQLCVSGTVGPTTVTQCQTYPSK